MCFVAWLYLCHWILLFPSQACWAICKHRNDLDGTNSALEWCEQHKPLAAVGWACRCLLLVPEHGDGCVHHVFCTDCFCVSCSMRLRHSKELVLCKVRKWVSPEAIRNDQIECLCGRKKLLWNVGLVLEAPYLWDCWIILRSYVTLYSKIYCKLIYLLLFVWVLIPYDTVSFNSLFTQIDFGL